MSSYKFIRLGHNGLKLIYSDPDFRVNCKPPTKVECVLPCPLLPLRDEWIRIPMGHGSPWDTDPIDYSKHI